MGEDRTKLAKAKRLHDAGDLLGCLAIVAKFPRLGAEKVRVERAWAATQHADTYRAMGYDVDQLVGDGIAAIRERYGWEERGDG